jgi:hypothetical protein
MKKRKYLETDFIRFLKEKYNDEEEETNPEPIEDEETATKDIEDEEANEILDELVAEYKKVKKEYHDLLLRKPR